MTNSVTLGRCCGCKTLLRVRNVVMLPWTGEIRGHGWGCLQCGLPSNGATVVLCEDCYEKLECGARIEDVATEECRGFPGSEGRRPFSPMSASHYHDMSRHPEHVAHGSQEPG